MKILFYALAIVSLLSCQKRQVEFRIEIETSSSGPGTSVMYSTESGIVSDVVWESVNYSAKALEGDELIIQASVQDTVPKLIIGRIYCNNRLQVSDHIVGDTISLSISHICEIE